MLGERRVETVAVVLIVALGVAGLASIRLASTYSLELAGKAWAYEAGNILVVGRIPGAAASRIQALPGVEASKLMLIKVMLARINDTPISLALVYNPSPSYPLSYVAEKPGEIMVYTTRSNPAVRPGDTLLIPGYGVIRVEGLARGVFRYAGGVDAVLLVPRGIVEKAPGRSEALLSVVASPGTSLEWLERRVRETVLSFNGTVERVLVQSEEENPAAKPLRSVSNAIQFFVSTALVAASLLIAGSEASLLERNIREIGILRAVGAGTWEITLYYAGYNVVRGALGIGAGLLASIPLAEKLVEWGMRREGSSVTMEILMKAYPYHPSMGSLIWVGCLAMALITASSLIPPLASRWIPVSRALRFTGLEGGLRLRLLEGRIKAAYAVRRSLSRPWLAVSMLVLITVSWGAATSIPMSVRGMDSLIHEVELYNYNVTLGAVAGARDARRAVDLAMGAKGVRKAEAWASMWGGVKLGGEDLLVSTCLEGAWRLGPMLAEGRWPEQGEAVVTETLAKLLGVRLGDRLRVTVSGETRVFRISGVARDHGNNGRKIYLSRQDYLGLFKTDYIQLRLLVDGDAGSIALEVKRILGEAGIPAKILSTRQDIIRELRSQLSFVKIFLTVVNASTLIAGFLGLAVLVVVDLAGRLREIGVLRAMGFTDLDVGLMTMGQVLVLLAVSALPAYLVGYAISSGMLALMEAAIGYVKPAPRPLDLASSGWTAIPLLLAALVSALLYLRRCPTSALLRVE